MNDINITQHEELKDYKEFTIKSKMRLAIFVILGIVSYLVCTISLFFGNGFILSAISFIFLFLLIYFIALDAYKIKFRYVLLVLFSIFLVETISFIIGLGFSWYLIIELILFNVAVGTLLFLLSWQLNHRITFSAFAYFTQGGFFVTSLLTVFFCVLMMGKYTQIPFTCNDIQSFPTKVVESTVNPFKKTWNNIIGWFNDEKKETLEKPNLFVTGNPLSKSTDLASADSVENFFVNMRNSIEEETLGVKNQVSLATCNNYISILQKTQQNEGIQIAGIVIGYLLLVGVFKILLWVVSIIGFILFIVMRIFGVYKYEKKMVEKEVIV